MSALEGSGNGFVDGVEMPKYDYWQRYNEFCLRFFDGNASIDCSRLRWSKSFFKFMQTKVSKALDHLDAIEAGEICNPDENRMVGHYWLRDAKLAPPQIAKAIESDIANIKDFSRKILTGDLMSGDKPFENLLIIGIGGSALGPQLMSECLKTAKQRLNTFYLDNTDPEGIAQTLEIIQNTGGGLCTTLCLVISKSGGTKETRNAMLATQNAFRSQDLTYARNFVAVTGFGSQLDELAKAESWLRRFPMYDWVGGRTSVMASVGLLPAALQGFDIDELLRGAREMDKLGRQRDFRKNPPMTLALAWRYCTGGKGARDMVVIPYKDKLSLLAKYLQQLIMESLGKKLDLEHKVVEQGISVYGNKGSTDQHAYIQQLRDGVNNFFATFVEVLADGQSVAADMEVEADTKIGYYLQGFLRGTREALSDGGRESVLISIARADAFHLGSLIALFERAVSFYANFVNINAYHQPGVEAGKKAAGDFIFSLLKVKNYLKREIGTKGANAQEIGKGLELAEEQVYHCLNYLAYNEKDISVKRGSNASQDIFLIK